MKLVTEMVDVPGEFAPRPTVVGLALIVKSERPRLIWTVFESPDVVPRTVNVNVPAGTPVGALNVRVDEFVPPDESFTLVGEMDAA